MVQAQASDSPVLKEKLDERRVKNLKVESEGAEGDRRECN